MAERPIRKRIRLDHAAYAIPGSIWHVSTNTLNRFPAFRDAEMAAIVVESISFQSSKAKAELLLYCVMSDHVHLVATIGEVDLITILQRFKSYTGHQWTKRTGRKPLWQESFHDHGVRQSENMDELVKYVIENPLRAGLVPEWQDYPWIGGSLLDDCQIRASSPHY